MIKHSFRQLIGLSAILVFLGIASGCSTEGTLGAVIGTTIVGGTTPSNQIEQIYYLGVFDPREQIDPTVYRVIVRGQASAISTMKFGSGWVPARLVDSLSTHISFKDGKIDIADTNDTNRTTLTTGRRLMLFGPEGFREAPKDSRLAIVMGSSPEDFFNAIDTVLGTVSQAQDAQRNTKLKKKLFEALLNVKNEKERLGDLDTEIKVFFSK